MFSDPAFNTATLIDMNNRQLIREQSDFQFAYRAWVEGAMPDREFRRYGRAALNYMAERDRRCAMNARTRVR